jgi:hypothetical protein
MTTEEMFALWANSAAGRAAIAEAAAQKIADDERRMAEHMAKVAAFEAARRDEIMRLDAT